MTTQADASTDAADVVGSYFEALGRGETDAALRHYAPTGRGRIHGVTGPLAPAESAAYFGSIAAAFPDWRMEVLDLVAQDDRVAVRWRLRGTFAGPGRFQGFEPNGARVDVEGMDLVWVRDGEITRLEAYTDGATIARQLGALPAQGSPAEQRLAQAMNIRTRIARRLAGGAPEPVADGVWRVQGQPARCNVYFVRDGDGVLMFDAGARTMTNAVAGAAASLGGLTRIVLGHGHTDHRGTAPALGAPVYCHADEVIDAEGSGGFRYWPAGLAGLPFPHRHVHRLLHARVWDGGPVAIAGTVAEGDDVAGFEVVHLPGHAPGLIALWRTGDRLALTSDAFYTLDHWARDSPPHLPFPIYNLDTEQARASLRKLAALEPSVAWPGHAEAVTGDVRAQLERAAAA